MGKYILLTREPSGDAVLLVTDTPIATAGCLASYSGGCIGTIENIQFCMDELLELLALAVDVYPAEQIYRPILCKEENDE